MEFAMIIYLGNPKSTWRNGRTKESQRNPLYTGIAMESVAQGNHKGKVVTVNDGDVMTVNEGEVMIFNKGDFNENVQNTPC